LAARNTMSDFQEFRTKNPLASDVAAVDEPRYTQHTPHRQLLNSKKIKKPEKTFSADFFSAKSCG
ncbi:hypothetical protein, partial [Labrenzia sp. 011]|uniref:hypothetical protein n=1 Tax=Labrenzia sp. 011 TaxID=2171494 RepID=UPI000D51AA7F